MAGLRMGCLPLEVERGRYTKTPYEMRTCMQAVFDGCGRLKTLSSFLPSPAAGTEPAF